VGGAMYLIIYTAKTVGVPIAGIGFVNIKNVLEKKFNYGYRMGFAQALGTAIVFMHTTLRRKRGKHVYKTA